MSNVTISDAVFYVGADDKELDLFESQYVIPNGISYNSYVIMDEKIVIMDTVDARATDEWFANVDAVLRERKPDYLVISHLEPDHAANIANLVQKYPDICLVGNAKTFQMLTQFFGNELDAAKKLTVKEGDELSIGKHTLTFCMAPMVHWPEVMVTYEKMEKILFSADGFGKFGALDTDEDWACEARRYYFNIVGKYGMQVQALLKKAAAMDIQMICPLHGPILKEDLSYYIGLYDIWSRYEPETEGVFVAYTSVHGNTKKAVEKLVELLEKAGVPKISAADLSRDDMAECIEDAFRYDRMILASTTYDAGLFPAMQDFLMHLCAKGYKKRTVGLVENGSWGPMAAKKMREILDTMSEITIVEPVVTIKSTMKETDIPTMEALARAIKNSAK